MPVRPFAAATGSGEVTMRRMVGMRGLFAACVLLLAPAMAGCSGSVFSSDAGWFSKKVELFDAPRWSRISYDEKNAQRREVTQADMVDASGYCAQSATVVASAQPENAPEPAPAPPTGPSNGPMQLGPNAPPPPPAAAAVPDAPPVAALNAGGIALGMTECDVVKRTGLPDRTDIATNPRGERAVTLTVTRGPWPGIYRFDSGRLVSIERAGSPPAPAKGKKKPAGS